MNLDMLKKKRKADEAFDPDYDYVYGIVSIPGMANFSQKLWYFL